eukprot:g13599.t1
MRSEIATIVAFGLSLASIVHAAPTYSCFDPPDEGQTNPLGEGMEDVVGADCCAALIDESDMFAGRFVVWDPVNCNHGPGESPIAEAPLCRAHDTDGCRFCRETCDGFEGLCITCASIMDAMETSSPTPSPSDIDPSFEETPTPTASAETDAPFDIFPETPAPVTPAPVTPAPVTPAPVTPAPTTPAPATPAPATPAPVTPEPTPAPVAVTPAPIVPEPSDCVCINTMSAEEEAVLTRRNKAMVCDPTCSTGEDDVFGVLNCNYFALGQNCRACSNICDEQAEGPWLDGDGFPCKPCSAI